MSTPPPAPARPSHSPTSPHTLSTPPTAPVRPASALDTPAQIFAAHHAAFPLPLPGTTTATTTTTTTAASSSTPTAGTAARIDRSPTVASVLRSYDQPGPLASALAPLPPAPRAPSPKEVSHSHGSGHGSGMPPERERGPTLASILPAFTSRTLPPPFPIMSPRAGMSPTRQGVSNTPPPPPPPQGQGYGGAGGGGGGGTHTISPKMDINSLVHRREWFPTPVGGSPEGPGRGELEREREREREWERERERERERDRDRERERERERQTQTDRYRPSSHTSPFTGAGGTSILSPIDSRYSPLPPAARLPEPAGYGGPGPERREREQGMFSPGMERDAYGMSEVDREREARGRAAWEEFGRPRRDREAREREARERDAQERDARERDARDREARERERERENTLPPLPLPPREPSRAWQDPPRYPSSSYREPGISVLPTPAPSGPPRVLPPSDLQPASTPAPAQRPTYAGVFHTLDFPPPRTFRSLPATLDLLLPSPSAALPPAEARYVYGTGSYTCDSDPLLCALHARVLAYDELARGARGEFRAADGRRKTTLRLRIRVSQPRSLYRASMGGAGIHSFEWGNDHDGLSYEYLEASWQVGLQGLPAHIRAKLESRPRILQHAALFPHLRGRADPALARAQAYDWDSISPEPVWGPKLPLLEMVAKGERAKGVGYQEWEASRQVRFDKGVGVRLCFGWGDTKGWQEYVPKDLSEIVRLAVGAVYAARALLPSGNYGDVKGSESVAGGEKEGSAAVTDGKTGGSDGEHVPQGDGEGGPASAPTEAGGEKSTLVPAKIASEVVQVKPDVGTEPSLGTHDIVLYRKPWAIDAAAPPQEGKDQWLLHLCHADDGPSAPRPVIMDPSGKLLIPRATGDQIVLLDEGVVAELARGVTAKDKLDTVVLDVKGWRWIPRSETASLVKDAESSLLTSAPASAAQAAKAQADGPTWYSSTLQSMGKTSVDYRTRRIYVDGMFVRDVVGDELVENIEDALHGPTPGRTRAGKVRAEKEKKEVKEAVKEAEPVESMEISVVDEVKDASAGGKRKRDSEGSGESSVRSAGSEEAATSPSKKRKTNGKSKKSSGGSSVTKDSTPADAAPAASKKKSHKAPFVFYSERTTRSSSRMNHSPEELNGAGDRKRKRDEEEPEGEEAGEEEPTPSPKKQKKEEGSPAEPEPAAPEGDAPAVDPNGAEQDKKRKREEDADGASADAVPVDDKPVAPLPKRQKKASPPVVDDAALNQPEVISEPAAAAAGLTEGETAVVTA
ncbi:hypothetical protein CALVIDRAFT_532400 [Calocera viscosa TUFC12733]|uniref:Uncharacterized protein n=1 Tax=Calocera viscosa (strain TUFC12733) TaxID=1330018 RepID=A0A167S6K2_CALVF|nr:hypothetical protein CALVIDRAFT_532400 [Calocera viscosa TUFC12733]